jgi:hypothetical protein
MNIMPAIRSRIGMFVMGLIFKLYADLKSNFDIQMKRCRLGKQGRFLDLESFSLSGNSNKFFWLSI